MWMASLSLTGAPVTIIIELLNLEKDEKVTCFNNPHVPRLKMSRFSGTRGSSKGGGGGEGCSKNNNIYCDTCSNRNQ